MEGVTRGGSPPWWRHCRVTLSARFGGSILEPLNILYKNGENSCTHARINYASGLGLLYVKRSKLSSNVHVRDNVQGGLKSTYHGESRIHGEHVLVKLLLQQFVQRSLQTSTLSLVAWFILFIFLFLL